MLNHLDNLKLACYFDCVICVKDRKRFIFVIIEFVPQFSGSIV